MLGGCPGHGASSTKGRIDAGIAIPPLTAEQRKPCPLPEARVGETYHGLAARLGGELIECRLAKADLVATHDDVRIRFGRSP